VPIDGPGIVARFVGWLNPLLANTTPPGVNTSIVPLTWFALRIGTKRFSVESLPLLLQVTAALLWT
jgi:hypothetical protein